MTATDGATTAVEPTGHDLPDELIELFARQGKRVPLPVFLCSLLLASIAWSELGGWLPWLWLSAVTLILAIRWKVLGSLPAAKLPIAGKLRVAVLLSGLNGLVQGASIGFAVALDTPERAVQSIILLGLCAGSVATTGGYRPAFVAFVAPTLLPLSAMWALGASGAAHRWVEYFTAALILVFGLVLLSLAKDAFRLLKESFEIRQEQVVLNRQLRSALDDAEAANRAKTRFLASASHDLRQPIHTLSLFSAALAMRPLDEATRQIAIHMNTALQALSAQLDSLLDVSKLDAGVVPVNKTTFSLSGFLARLAGEYAPLAGARGLVLTTQCPRDASCETDEVLLSRIARNLLENAIKYTPHGEIALRAHADADAWVISVEDTGIGIPEAEHQRVFEEFYQLHNPERDRSRGLGLGLSIVRRLAQLLELGIDMSSSPGQGTRFAVTVPRGNRDSAASCGVGGPMDGLRTPDSLTGTRVLVLDDEEAVRHGMEALLQAFGCQVRSAGCIADAVTQCRSMSPDILLVDLRLRGDENGIAAIEQLRSTHPALPAILVSGDTAPDRIKDAHGAGIAMLHKPVSAQALHQAITHEVLSGSRRHEPATAVRHRVHDPW
ncbi:MAG TPA: hybrid sensor histidine kinase/response regulator [Ramlibacter sp.]|nr:hybrid sensor histidine kinase/response regulator [Ramlibacter sp.]